MKNMLSRELPDLKKGFNPEGELKELSFRRWIDIEERRNEKKVEEMKEGGRMDEI